MSIKNMPVVPLRGLTVFPNMVISFPIGRKLSLDAVEASHDNDDMIFLITQKDSEENEPTEDGLAQVGTVCKIKQVLKLPANVTHIIVEGLHRAYAQNTHIDEYFVSDAEIIDDKLPSEYEEDIQAQALMRLANEDFEKYTKLNNAMPANDVMLTLISAKTPGQLADAIAAGINISNEEKLRLLETIDPIERIKRVIEILTNELEILELKSKIEKNVRKNIDESQKEYYLREQLKVISEELGDKDGIQGIKDGFLKKAQEKNLPEYVLKTVTDECERMVKIPVTSPEFNVSRTYIESILKLPWSEKTEENKDLKLAEKILDEDHYGLKDVKERILQFIAVRMNTSFYNMSCRPSGSWQNIHSQIHSQSHRQEVCKNVFRRCKG